MSLKPEQSLASPYKVTRRISIPGLKYEHQVQELVDGLSVLDGVDEVTVLVRQQVLRLSYEANRIGFTDIIAVLKRLGLPPSRQWWMRLKMQWYRFTDENVRANAATKAGACCSQPSDIYAQRHKRR